MEASASEQISEVKENLAHVIKKLEAHDRTMGSIIDCVTQLVHEVGELSHTQKAGDEARQPEAELNRLRASLG